MSPQHTGSQPSQADRPPGVPRSSGQSGAQAPLPPPPSQAPLPPQNAEMTQRFGAPVAPANSPFRQGDVQSQAAHLQQPAQNWQREESPAYPPAQGQFNQHSQPYAPPDYEDVARGGSIFDAVTIALMVVAFFAVICLIPLYLAVIQARFG